MSVHKHTIRRQPAVIKHNPACQLTFAPQLFAVSWVLNGNSCNRNAYYERLTSRFIDMTDSTPCIHVMVWFYASLMHSSLWAISCWCQNNIIISPPLVILVQLNKYLSNLLWSHSDDSRKWLTNHYPEKFIVHGKYGLLRVVPRMANMLMAKMQW